MRDYRGILLNIDAKVAYINTNTGTKKVMLKTGWVSSISDNTVRLRTTEESKEDEYTVMVKFARLAAL